MQIRGMNRVPILAFQLCIIANSVFGSDAELFQISKLVMFGFFAIMVLSIFLQSGRFCVGRQLIFPMLFILYSVISVVWSYNREVASSQLITQLQLIVLLVFTYMIMMQGAQIKDYLNAVYIAGWGMVVFALTRYGGFDQYLEAMEEGTRMGDEITNQNVFGMVFSNAALAAAYYMIFRKRKLDVISIAVFTFFALSSGSKKATLMIIVGILGIVTVHYGIKKIYKTVLSGAAVLLLAWFVLQLPIFETINERLTSFFSGELNAGDEIRQDMIRFGIEMFEERPILGYGLSNYALFHITGVYSHNNYIEVLVSLGFVGFVLYHLMYIVPVCKIFLGRFRKFAWQNKEYLMLLVWLAVDLVFANGMVQLYEKNSYILLGVALATADKLASDYKKEKTKVPQENY